MEKKNNVRIRTISGKINPSPKKPEASHSSDDNMQSILDSIIGEEFLKKESGAQNLLLVERLEIQVNTTFQSILGISELTPNLKDLILDNSIISSIRDLGVGFNKLQRLSMRNCGISELDGIGVLVGLLELNLANNFITDVAPLAMHENIEVRARKALGVIKIKSILVYWYLHVKILFVIDSIFPRYYLLRR
jgi:Leucine-rich repeat (LRR) protein